MDNKTLAQFAVRMARDDTFDDVGRILLTDLNANYPFAKGAQNITAEQVIKTIKEHYPEYDTIQRTDNIILIYWRGLQRTQTERSQRGVIC